MIISFDPSGNWNEGKGTTGICLAWNNGEIHKVDELQALVYNSPEDYWHAHLIIISNYITVIGDLEVIMEGFRLYEHKKSQQVYSQFETPQLIGVIRHFCHKHGIPLKIQYASEVKNRWTDTILEKEGFLYTKNRQRYLSKTGQPLNNHKTDALRHMCHYLAYTREKHLGEWENDRGPKEGDTV